jgi:hypothetical protein
MNENYEKQYAYELINKGIFVKPDNCPLCGKKNVSINKYFKDKKTNIYFRCRFYKCKN